MGRRSTPFTLPIDFMLRKGDVLVIQRDSDIQCNLPKVFVGSPLYKASVYCGHNANTQPHPLQVAKIQRVVHAIPSTSSRAATVLDVGPRCGRLTLMFLE